MSISLKADPSGTFGEILVNGAVVAKLPVTGNAVIPGLVGTVSQSGGVPTGAIIEQGSNANGRYIKYADGTMVCHNPIRGTSGGSSWTYPAQFSETPSIAIACLGANLARFVTASSGNNAGTTLYGWTNTGAESGVGAGAVAYGRWY